MRIIQKKGLKTLLVVFLIMSCVLLLMFRYYFFSTWNVNYAQYMNMELEHYYEDFKFTVLNKKVNVYKEQEDLYRFEYVAILSDGDIEFRMVKNMYDSKRLGGHWHDEDYWGFRDDYIRKKIAAAGIDLSQYEIEFMDAVINDKPDYVFNMTANNKETIIKLVYEVMCLGLEDYKLDLWFKILDENGEPLVDSYDLFKACMWSDEEINESNLEEFIRNELDKH